MVSYIYVFLYTLRSGINVPTEIIVSKIFYSRPSYSSHLIYLFFEQIPNTNESKSFSGFLILLKETLHLTFRFFTSFYFFVGIVSKVCYTNVTSCHDAVTYKFHFGGPEYVKQSFLVLGI